ncbi:MAG: hypothetical protein ACRDDL_01125 [Sarcina sp.]
MIDKKLSENISIKRYEKIANKNDYYMFYKNLGKDFSSIRKLLNERNLCMDRDYFNFIITFWYDLKESYIYQYKNFNSYIDKYMEDKSNFKFETYEDYYKKNSERNFIKSTTDSKIINLRVNNYIHQKAIERLIIEEIKSSFNIQDKDVYSEFFLNKIFSKDYNSLSANTYLIDTYGNYVDTSIQFEQLNYFFCACILTQKFIIIKPIKVNYKNVYSNDKERIYKFLLTDISKIKFYPRGVQYIFKNDKVLNKGYKILKMDLTNYGMFKFKNNLLKYAKDKNIDFEIEKEKTNKILSKKNIYIIIAVFGVLYFLIIILGYYRGLSGK